MSPLLWLMEIPFIGHFTLRRLFDRESLLLFGAVFTETYQWVARTAHFRYS